ncbi:MAG: hypothetical protein CW345_07025 [Firmicutes bacterium]|nr:hypothetical protein [Bacillota bacterium]MBO2521540.1 hypothetical protein [Bacillota bacterium]
MIAPHFIHAGLTHIAFNMYALYIFGRLVEGLIGTGRFLAVYFVGGIIGAYASLLMRPDGLAVGASAAIFGLMGYTLHYRLRRLPKRWLSIDSSFAQILGLNLIIGFTVPNVDQYAHLGGLIGGALAASLVGLPEPWPATRPRAGPLERAAALVLIALLSWAALSPLSLARATGQQAVVAWAEARYGRYFAPFVAADAAVLWTETDRGQGEWRRVGRLVDRPGESPIALGVYWRWERGGGRAGAGEYGEYSVYWQRLDAAGQWELWRTDRGTVFRADSRNDVIYRRSLIAERWPGEFDGRWRVSVEVDGWRQYQQEFEVASSSRRL